MYRTEAQIKAANREISRVSRKTPKRVIEARKPGPCFVTTFPPGQRPEQAVLFHEDSAPEPAIAKKKDLPTPLPRVHHIPRIARREEPEIVQDAPQKTVVGNDYAAAINAAIRSAAV